MKKIFGILTIVGALSSTIFADGGVVLFDGGVVLLDGGVVLKVLAALGGGVVL